ncbi:hypothetical protein C8Q72DRAFT_864833 [Fomitopsis betulina]|nr:hypothetical protein C8Q72DRAFT_864833 [Fomitopsis betulina]
MDPATRKFVPALVLLAAGLSSASASVWKRQTQGVPSTFRFSLLVPILTTLPTACAELCLDTDDCIENAGGVQCLCSSVAALESCISTACSESASDIDAANQYLEAVCAQAVSAPACSRLVTAPTY